MSIRLDFADPQALPGDAATSPSTDVNASGAGGHPPDGAIASKALRCRFEAPLHTLVAHTSAQVKPLLDAVDRFAAPDYWRRDSAVKSWFYDSRLASAAGRNIDAVRVFYHAGHGRTDENGRFRLPMGALWTGTDACLDSERMWLGADKLRYVFWSTSESLCVTDGRNPLRSWARSNAGLRMMFGFDTVCWDSGAYGANFWRHWRMGKSFSQSWLDGAWDVSHDQSPVVAACGASQQEALASLFHERRFDAARAKGEWWAWRWHTTLASHRREPVLDTPPDELRTARLVPVTEDMALAHRVLTALGIAPRLVPHDDQGRMSISYGTTRFSRRADGHILLELASGAPGDRERCRVPLQRRAIVNRARGALRRHGFVLPGSELIFDRISLALSASQCLHMLGEPPVETLDEIIVQFRQSIDGIPASAKVGTSGSSGERCAAVVASARILPPLICAAPSAVETNAAATSPAMIAVTASPVAR